MYTGHLIQLLLVALSMFSVAQSFMVDANMVARSDKKIIRRQGSGSSSSPTADATTSSTPTTSSDPTTSNPPPTSTTPTSTSTSTTPTSSTPPPPTSTTPTSTSSTPPPTTSDQTMSQSQTSTEPISTSTYVVTTTASDGSTFSYTTESATTPTPTLSPGSGNSTSGMTETTRNTIIGVVVGVGGAIILAVIAFVAWRIWGRKKAQDENDDMMNYGGGYTGPTDKSDAGTTTTGTTRSPFQSTLESYHAPTQVNTASNF